MTTNPQLEETLALLSGGVQNIDPNLAVTHLRSWQATLSDHPDGTVLVARLGKVAEQLQAGQYAEAAATLPQMGAEVQALARTAPEEDQEPLRQLAEMLHLANGGLDAGQ